MIERAVMIGEGQALGVEDLGGHGDAEVFGGTPGAADGKLQFEGQSLAEVESKYIEHVFRSTRGSIKRSSEILGIGRSTLWRRIKELGIQPEW